MKLSRAVRRKLAVNRIVELHVELHTKTLALRDLLALYDRKELSGWTVGEVERLIEIREVANACIS